MSEPQDIEQATYWEHRYQAKTDVWDIGQPAPALLAWLAAHPGRRGRAIVLGCGPGHDAVALAEHGFEVAAIDFAPSAVAATAARAAAAGVALEALEADMFALPARLCGSADVVFEHTCFCTLDAARHAAYWEVVAGLLKPGGELVGVFFTFEDVGEGGPPFPIRPEALLRLLSPAFEVVSFAPATCSIDKRQGDEHVGIFRRR